MADSTSTSSGCLAPFKGFSTQVIHQGQEPEQWKSNAVVPPISMSTTFKQDAPGQHKVNFMHYSIYYNNYTNIYFNLVERFTLAVFIRFI